MERSKFEVEPIGYVRSPLIDRDAAPRQGDEGAPEAEIVLDPPAAPGLDGIVPGQEVLVLTWLHLADRRAVQVHPRGDSSRPLTGVFATRSPDRPNPIGLHRVLVSGVDDATLKVTNLEAVDGTPVLDLKPILSSDPGDR